MLRRSLALLKCLWKRLGPLLRGLREAPGTSRGALGSVLGSSENVSETILNGFRSSEEAACAEIAKVTMLKHIPSEKLFFRVPGAPKRAGNRPNVARGGFLGALWSPREWLRASSREPEKRLRRFGNQRNAARLSATRIRQTSKLSKLQRM